jgi:3-hydroxyisobutyrate dehydrogenase-like beta-hydroxyacid dehydrogenase
MSSSSEPRAHVGIISIGDMGVGIAKLLIAKGYAVATNATGRRLVDPPPMAFV